MNDSDPPPQELRAGRTDWSRLRWPGGDDATDAEPVEAIPAATVILGRDVDGLLEILMLRRDSKLAFAGGMWVFPGGRIDPADHAGDTDPEAAAAAREAAEESGLVVDPASLVRLSHWTPPPATRRRFSTAFFVAPAPAGAVVIDDGEIRAHRWVTPADALAAQARGEIELAPPTFITLVQLARSASVAEMVERAAAGPVEHFSTRIVVDGDDVVALYHGDRGYDSGELGGEGPVHRLLLSPGGWSYQRSDQPGGG